jgi:hypothetical protein
MKDYIAACIMHKNDLDALVENIEYHKLLGFDKIIIYDNKSDIDISVLSKMDNVILREWRDEKIGSQARCYNNCINEFKDHFKWIAFIDTDEFIVLNNGETCIKKFIKDYETYGGLGINWKCFGSSGHVKKQKSIINSYIHYKENKHIKSIVNTEYVIESSGNPHSFKYKKGYYCVNELFEKINSEHSNAFNSPPTYLKVQINHYITRSWEDFEEKVKRGGGNNRSNKKLNKEFWNNFQNGEEETSIIELIKKINK